MWLQKRCDRVSHQWSVSLSYWEMHMFRQWQFTVGQGQTTASFGSRSNTILNLPDTSKLTTQTSASKCLPVYWLQKKGWIFHTQLIKLPGFDSVHSLRGNCPSYSLVTTVTVFKNATIKDTELLPVPVNEAPQTHFIMRGECTFRVTLKSETKIKFKEPELN